MSTSAFRLALGAAIAVGAALRLTGIQSQVLGGDELHALRVASNFDLAEILITYSVADHSIPLTALYKISMLAGATPSELLLRAPILATGILTVALLPLACRRVAGAPVAATLAGLLALSPVLVLYSRIVRPYMLIVLLAAIAVICFARWLETRRRGYALGYVLAAPAAIWFHPLSAPFVTAPLLFATGWRVLDRLRSRESSAPSCWSIALVCAGLLLALGAVLVPARESLLDLLATQRQPLLPRLAAWPIVAHLQLGSAYDGVIAVYAAAAVVGFVSLARALPSVAAYTSVLVIVQVAALLVLRPAGIDVPLSLNRYLLVCTPLFLFWVSAGLVLPWRFVGGRAQGAAAATAVVALALGLVASPFAQRAYRTSSFVHHNDFLAFGQSRPRVAPADVPAFYRSLSDEPGALVEFPWHPWWVLSSAVPIYQEMHGRRVIVSASEPELIAYCSSLRNFVAPTPTALTGSGAGWVVVHLDIGAEEDLVRTPPNVSRRALSREFRRSFRATMRVEGAKLSARLEETWGPPDHTDARIHAWRLPRDD